MADRPGRSFWEYHLWFTGRAEYHGQQEPGRPDDPAVRASGENGGEGETRRQADQAALPPVLADPAAVKEGIAQAKQSAAERKVPLTVERVAACLHVEPADIREAVRRTKAVREGAASRRETGPRTARAGTRRRAQQEAGQALEEVSAECRALLMEQGLARSSSPVMPIFGLRVHFGYDERAAGQEAPPAVRFEGEEEIPE